MARITKIEATKDNSKRKLRVAAYARVSTDSNEQLVSLETQKNHYERYIKARPDWEYVGLYYDEGVSGTSMDKRDGLLHMLDDCDRGLIDYIIVKSISRFSRNTVDSIETVRRLCEKGIYIFFEKENIDTGKMEGELLLSILSSLAESESHSIAENNKWSIQKRFQNGTFKIGYTPYGYDNVDGQMVVNEEQAKTVRWIFEAILSGMSPGTIARKLNEKGIRTKRDGRWTGHTVNGMIRNEKYTGDVIMQKTYTDDRFNRHINRGERTQYLAGTTMNRSSAMRHLRRQMPSSMQTVWKRASIRMRTNIRTVTPCPVRSSAENAEAPGRGSSWRIISAFPATPMCAIKPPAA